MIKYSLTVLVLGLISLISPLTCGSDFRPYFTIHDSDFKLIQNKQKVQIISLLSLTCLEITSTILGVTNPIFCKALQHWPHTIFIGDIFSVK